MNSLRYVVSGLIVAFLLLGTAQAAERNFHIRIEAHNIDKEELSIEGHTFEDVRTFGAMMKPSHLTVNKGDKVQIKVENKAPISEGFNIGAYDIHKTLKPGETQTVSFVADKTGAFTIWCHLHPDALHLPGTLNVL